MHQKLHSVVTLKIYWADCSAKRDNGIGMVTIITIVRPFPTSKAAESD